MILFGLLVLGVVGVLALSAFLAVAGALLHALVWLLVLPFRLLGAMLVLPFMLLRGLVMGVVGIAGVAIVAILAAVFGVAIGLAVLAPLLPLLIVGGLIWLTVRAFRRRPVVI